MIVALALFAAHGLGDFVFQTKRDVAHKDRPAVLLKHGVIHAGLTYVLLGIPGAWPIPLAVLVTHVAIDFVKTRLKQGGLKTFVGDQVAHLVILVGIAAVYVNQADPTASVWVEAFGAPYVAALALAAGLVITVRMGAFFVDFAVEPFLEQIEYEQRAETRIRGLREGGRTIGQLERALIFVFVLIDQFTAIGFLIAAKSIFRFGELRERGNRMEAEYIIIGTLISFLWAIIVALITRSFVA